MKKKRKKNLYIIKEDSPKFFWLLYKILFSVDANDIRMSLYQKVTSKCTSKRKISLYLENQRQGRTVKAHSYILVHTASFYAKMSKVYKS